MNKVKEWWSIIIVEKSDYTYLDILSIFVDLWYKYEEKKSEDGKYIIWKINKTNYFQPHNLN